MTYCFVTNIDVPEPSFLALSVNTLQLYSIYEL